MEGRRKEIIYLLNIFFPLLLGTALYLWIKPNAWCSNVIYGFLRLEKFRAFDETSVPIFGSFIKHQLCDMLFAHSLTFAMLFTFRKEKHGFFLACSIAALFEILFEVAQLWGFPGHFDPFDILAEAVVTFMILLCMKIYNNQKGRKQKT